MNLIKSLRISGLKVIENPLRAQVYGAYGHLIPIFQNEMTTALVAVERVMLYIKNVKSDRR
jgi:hypothetical protein